MSRQLLQQELKNALLDNSLLNYTPSAPVHLIHGDADSTVPFFISTAALDYYESQGKTNVDLVLVQGNHEEAAETAMIGAMTWFETLRDQ